jgi:molybdopterin-containing oxidoreductase family membrane subunit
MKGMRLMDRANGNGHSSTATSMAVGLTPQEVTDNLSRKVYSLDRRFLMALGVLGILFILGVVGFIARAVGDGFSDAARPQWGYYAAMFGFLLVTAGTAPLAAIAFRWTKNHWRRPFSRASEMYALVGILSILWFIPMMFLLPGIDLNGDGLFELGTDRRTIWFEGPMGAPLWWDMLAVIGLVVCGLALLCVSARPDMAEVGRRGSGFRAGLMRMMAMGWQGTKRDWHRQKAFIVVLGAFYFMMLVFVHMLVSLDFALSLVPGWKDSIFAPHHVLTGFQAASGTMLVTMFIMRNWGGYQQYIGLDPFWSFAKVLLGLTLLWGYFWFSEFMTFWYGRDPTELSVIKLVMFESYRTAFLLNLFFSFVIPFFILLWNGLRQSIIGPTIAGVSVIIGAFFMMVRIYVPAFNIPQENLGAHSIAEFESGLAPIAPQLLPVTPDVWDVFIILGGISAIAIIFLLGTKIIPAMSIWETKEGLLYIVYRQFMRGRYLVLGKPE